MRTQKYGFAFCFLHFVIKTDCINNSSNPTNNIIFHEYSKCIGVNLDFMILICFLLT